MRRICAIAAVTIRQAVRSRTVWVLLALLMAAVIVLPLTIKGDGTPAGRAQVLLHYTLGAAAALLTLATLWAGCAAISMDLQDRKLHLVAVKPVTRAQIWLGQWLGLMFLNACLLTAAAGITYGLFQVQIRPAALSSAERASLETGLLTTRQVLQLLPEDVEQNAQREFAELRERNALPEGTAMSDVLAALRHKWLARQFTVEPNGQHAWHFRLPAAAAGQPLQLTYRFAVSRGGDAPVGLHWRISDAGGTIFFEAGVTNRPETVQTLEVPGGAGAGELRVECAQTDDQPRTVVFAPGHGIRLAARTGSFEANFLRAILVLLIRLAFIAALGVTAGALFSMPVAVLAAGTMLLLIATADFTASLTTESFFGAPDAASRVTSVLNAAVQTVFRGLHALAAPLQEPNPLEWLAAGRWIAAPLLWHALLIRGVCGVGLLALIGIGIFNRRELAAGD